MSSCHQRKSHSIIKVEEQGERSTFKLHNPKKLEVEHFKLDECQARGNQLGCKEQTKTCAFQNNLKKKVSNWQGQKRCDALLEIAEKETQIFVELKGQDIAAGIEQLEASLNLFAKDNWQKKLFLSCNTKRLNNLNTKIKRFKARLRKRYKKTDFDIKSEHRI
ncbi:hypothetical protein SapgrDRAFT_3345 [Saprospira grandis DSM 2844]|uniref:Uncharacterized protein n=1 Tax=Saprospira grandis DSM 2844 TaxID=694433 RepID=J0PBG3_9BACT|nr:hypothetical protein [Saprospira grandis]EJF54987.1 hypothetical protein SapgrDRAFT_3345 [Saprospira grandis DSM 2844]